MNGQVLMLFEHEMARDGLLLMGALGISAAPVVNENLQPIGVVSWRDLLLADDSSTVGNRKHNPVYVVRPTDTLGYAADVLADQCIHRVFVVDELGVLVGVLSVVDVLRAQRGHHIEYPILFPHINRCEGVTWTEQEPLSQTVLHRAPSAAGVLVISHKDQENSEQVVFAEKTEDVQGRARDIINEISGGSGFLSHDTIDPNRLHFRAAIVCDGHKQDAIARTFRVHPPYRTVKKSS